MRAASQPRQQRERRPRGVSSLLSTEAPPQKTATKQAAASERTSPPRTPLRVAPPP
eukprot:CAMPEP_0114157562 /NCGR_PEP_ID=MMETSP0043_2-20121206/26687_1 /TAXON_ID=464988 /ORGANISM="Hemiselmis andersenii, Strain CCMP644" /LENGTH=55 /DNA_ID=CAMNT_0001253137 /DNA_START=151 /DNA_END=314 /DNA_ORIENTATION=+